MSKRKSILVANSSEDFAFEDQDMEFESTSSSNQKKVKLNSQQNSSITTTNINSSSTSRVSGRTKKIKSIYDPSESQKPIAKRKKEGQEGEKSRNSSVSENVKPIVSSPIKVKPQEQSIKPTTSTPITTEVVKNPTKIKTEKTPRSPSTSLLKSTTTNGKTIEKPKQIIPPTPAIIPISLKEPSKRIQEKKKKVSLSTDSKIEKKSVPPTIEKTEKVEKNHVKITTNDVNGNAIPDVREWSESDVSDYFHNKLGFSKRESNLFRDEEIDGEALLIMKRSDIVNNKLTYIKLGTAIKFWSHILRFQTKSNDPTQAWN